jgi:hypothetical protein
LQGKRRELLALYHNPTSSAKNRVVGVEGYDQRPPKAPTLQIFGTRTRGGKTKVWKESGCASRDGAGRGTVGVGRVTGPDGNLGLGFFSEVKVAAQGALGCEGSRV